MSRQSTNTQASIRLVRENSPNENEVMGGQRILWQPQWKVDISTDCEMGITIDDGCFVVLAQDFLGNWKPSKHIPIDVAQRLGELARHYIQEST